MASGARYGVAVRAAQSADTAELCRLLRQAHAGLEATRWALRVEAVRQQPNSAVLVATGYAGLSGMAAVTAAASLLHDRPVARVLALVVDAEEQRRGIGRMLLKAASQAARTMGCDVLELLPDGGNAGMEAFCQATGFTTAGMRFTRPLRRRGE